MRYVFLVAAVLALVARVTVFTDPSHIEALAIFGAFWLCAGIFLAGHFLAE
jgi:uncharacterized membrane protein HdeD (DUF308 family)